MKLKTPYLLRAKLNSWPHLFRTIIEIKPFRIHHGRQFELWYERSNSYYMFHVIVWCGLFTSCRKLKTELYEKRNDFTFPMVNFPCISSNIPGSPACVVYISQLIRYSRACHQYSDFLDIGELLTEKRRKQWYAAPRLKSLLQTLYGRHHDPLIVTKYPNLKWQWIILFTYICFLSSITVWTLTDLTVNMSNTAGVF